MNKWYSQYEILEVHITHIYYILLLYKILKFYWYFLNGLGKLFETQNYRNIFSSLNIPISLLYRPVLLICILQLHVFAIFGKVYCNKRFILLLLL